MLRLGIDVGGTFTDFVGFDEESGRIWHLKVLTTPREPVNGIMEAIEAGIGVSKLGEVNVIVHATTLGTNMFLGQTGIEPPKAVFVTNEGFIDIIEIGRQNRPELYNLFYKRPEPLVPRNRRIGVKGRIGVDGKVIEELDEEHLATEVQRHCREGVRVFAVTFLHSYKNPEHEIRAKEVILKECPNATVTLSHEVDPQPMEYERASTTLVNAVLKPLLGAYLTGLWERLSKEGFQGKLLVMQSSGGVADVEYALHMPAAFIESGPSAGAIAVAYLSRQMGISKALGFDMGGTTAKASSIIEGTPDITTLYEVGGKIHMGRLVRGSGYPVRYPYIDLAEVSAGGGTIAWIDPGGGLRVGPISAGADLGPACYGLGGKDPTITDANLFLGRLPEKLADGKLLLRKDLAVEALKKISEPLGISLEEAAWSIIKISNTIMSKALRLVSVERGHDPREFTMYAFGGAGPLHAAEIALDLGVPQVVVPPLPGVFSALGLLVTDYKHSFSRPIVRTSDKVTDEELESVFKEMEQEANTILEREGIPPERRVMHRYVEAKYWGQGYTLQVPYAETVEATAKAFHSLHEKRYGFHSPEEPVELVIARLDAVGIVEKPVLKKESRGTVEFEPVGSRQVFFESGWTEASVYDIRMLPVGAEIEGPAIIEAPDSTIVIPPRSRGVLRGDGSLFISLRW